MSTELERLAEHLHRPVGESDRERARLHLLDWLACVAGGRRSEVGKAAKFLASPIERAAMLGNVLEMDDVHRAGRLHPGPVIWPAVLLAGRGDFLAGAVAGYEAMIALGSSLDARHYAHWHPTSTVGGAGAAATAARMSRASLGETADALGHAVSLAGGLWNMRHGDSMTKQMHVLHAASWGVRCTALARCGFTGARGSLDGPQGWWKASCDQAQALQLGDGWRIAEVSLKPWAACRHAHPAIDAALELRGTEGEVLVETYGDALTFCDRPDPETAAEARFSIQHAVAVALERGRADPEDFEPDAIAALAKARARVRIAEDRALTARYPEHFGARVHVGGRTVERLDTLGDPERPLSVDCIHAKLETLVAWGDLPAAEVDAAKAAAASADEDVIVALLQRWTV